MKGKDAAKAAAVNPLIVDGRKLIPSVTRVFSRGRELYVYLQAYEEGTGQAVLASRPIVAYVSFYRDHAKVFETQPLAITPAATAKLAMMPLSFNIAVAQLQPGEYDCQVTILDPTSGKATFWNAPLKIVQEHP